MTTEKPDSKAQEAQKKVAALLGQIGLSLDDVRLALGAPAPAPITHDQLTAAVKDALIQLGVPQKLEGQVKHFADQQAAETAQLAQAQTGQPDPRTAMALQIVGKLFGGDQGPKGGFSEIIEAINQMNSLKRAILGDFKEDFGAGMKYALDMAQTAWRTGGDPSNINVNDIAKRAQDKTQSG